MYFRFGEVIGYTLCANGNIPQPLMSERAFVVAYLSELSYFQNSLRATTRERMAAERL